MFPAVTLLSIISVIIFREFTLCQLKTALRSLLLIGSISFRCSFLLELVF